MEKVSFNSNVFQLSEHSTVDRLLYCILVFWHLSDSLNILELFRNYAGFQRPVIELQELNTAEKKILSSCLHGKKQLLRQLANPIYIGFCKKSD